MALTLVANERQQNKDKLSHNSKNKLALKERSFWNEQLELVFKYIGELGRSPESVQISAETEENKFVVKQKGKTESLYIVAVLIFAMSLILAICYCTCQNNMGVAFFLCGILAFVVLIPVIMYFLHSYEKRNR